MSKKSTIVAVVLACLLVAPALFTGVGAASAADAGPTQPALALQEAPADGDNTTTTDSEQSTQNQTSTADYDDLEAARNDTDREADITISQSRYIDADTTTVRENGRLIHTASGNYLEIGTAEFDYSDVKEFGVEGDVGRLSYDSATSRYVFNAEQTSGTYQMYWVVPEEVTVSTDNGRTITETVDRRHTATIRVSDAEQTLVADSQLDDLRESASNWDEWTQSIRDTFGENADIEEHTQNALNWLMVTANPTAFLTGDFFGILIALFTTAGGLLLVTLALLVFAVSTFALYRYRNRRESLDPDESTLDEKLADIEQSKLQQSLEGCDLNEIYTDPNTAEDMRFALGESVHDAVTNYIGNINPNDRMLVYRLCLMGHVGYRGVVSRADDGVILDGRLVEPDDSVDLADDEEEVPLDEETLTDDDELVDVLYADDLVEQFRPHTDVPDDPDTLETVEDLSLDDIVARIDERSVHDTEVKRERADQLVEMLEFVRQHPYTDDSGRVKPMRKLINDLLRLMWSTSDKHDAPLVRYQIEHLLYLLDTTSVEDETAALINRTQNGDFSPETDGVLSDD